MKETLEQIGKAVELVGEEVLVIRLGIVNEPIQLGAECGLGVLSHQLLKFDN